MDTSAFRVLVVSAGLAAAGTPMHAHAAAFVAVHNMFSVSVSEFSGLTETQRSQISFSTALSSWTPSETISGAGTLDVAYSPTSAIGSGQAGAYIQATAAAPSAGHALGSYVLNIALDVTNGTGMDLSGLVLDTWFSAFAPFLSADAQVDRAPQEYAAFDSRQSGPGIGDGHGCDTRTMLTDPAMSNYVRDGTPPSLACGVPSPDHSMMNVYLDQIRAGETVSLTYALSVTVEAFSVIEPASLALFAPATLGLLALRRRRAT